MDVEVLLMGYAEDEAEPDAWAGVELQAEVFIQRENDMCWNSF